MNREREKDRHDARSYYRKAECINRRNMQKTGIEKKNPWSCKET